MPDPEDPAVEVAYALGDRQTVVRVALTPGMTALGAVEDSGLLRTHDELRGRALDLGIFGRRVSPDRLLDDGDRVEIYRPLPADPREARRRLAAEAKGKGSRGGGQARR